MKIYVSEKENIDLSKKCYLTFSTKDEQTVDWNVLAQSLEQHDAEIKKPLEDEIIELKEHIRALKQLRETDYDTIRKIERLNVIAELEEFENEHRLRARKMIEKYPTENEEQTTRLYGLMNGRLDILENLKQKLNEMKEVRDENLHK